MTINIVQKDGSKTPIDISLLVKVAQSGRLSPDTKLERDGKMTTARELPELADIFKELGVPEAPVVAVPPRAEEASKSAKPKPKTKPASKRASKSAQAIIDREISRIAKKRVDEKYRYDFPFTALIALAGIFLFLFCLDLDLGDGIGFVIFTISGIGIFGYFGIRSCLRANALLNEEAAIRLETLLRKSDKKREE